MRRADEKKYQADRERQRAGGRNRRGDCSVRLQADVSIHL